MICTHAREQEGFALCICLSVIQFHFLYCVVMVCFICSCCICFMSMFSFCVHIKERGLFIILIFSSSLWDQVVISGQGCRRFFCRCCCCLLLFDVLAICSFLSQLFHRVDTCVMKYFCKMRNV